jgi:UDP-glucose 4-epimerase
VFAGSLAREPRGDPPALVADAKRAGSELGWTPRLHELETIIAHAWAWERKVAGRGVE